MVVHVIFFSVCPKSNLPESKKKKERKTINSNDLKLYMN